MDKKKVRNQRTENRRGGLQREEEEWEGKEEQNKKGRIEGEGWREKRKKGKERSNKTRKEELEGRAAKKNIGIKGRKEEKK